MNSKVTSNCVGNEMVTRVIQSSSNAWTLYRGRMSIISRALLCAVVFLNERNSAATVDGSSVSPVFFLRQYADAEERRTILSVRARFADSPYISKERACKKSRVGNSASAHTNFCADGSFW